MKKYLLAGAFAIALMAVPSFNSILAYTWTAQTGSGVHSWRGITSSSDGMKVAAVEAGSYPSYAGYVHTSVDGGTTWTTQLGSGANVWGSIAGSSDGTKLIIAKYYAGFGADYIYSSTDSGVTWTTHSGSSGLGHWTSLASSSDGLKLVATDYGTSCVAGGYIHTSTDGGVTWTTNGGSSGINCWRSVASSSDGLKLVASAYGGNFYTSTDGGVTWVMRLGAGTGIRYSIASSSDGTKLSTIGYTSAYFQTTNDSGLTWTGSTVASYGGFMAITSSSDGSKLVIANNGGPLFSSNDSGLTWTEELSAGWRNWQSLASSADGTKFFAGDVGGYIYSSAYSLPTVVTDPATSVTINTAILNGHLSSLGGAPTVTEGFEYGTTTAYGSTTLTFTPTTPGTFAIGPLPIVYACNTLYHYRAYATNSAGTAYGADVTFTTLPCASTYLPQTIAYITAETAGGATFTTPQKDAIDRWFRDVLGYTNTSYATSNVFSKIKIAYLSLTGIYGADRVNAVTPGIYNYTDVGSPIYSTVTKNVRYNGTSQYSDTTFVPNGSMSFTASNFTGFGVHRTDTTGGGSSGGQVGEIGGGNSYMNLGSAWKTIVGNAQTAFNQADTRAINGMWFNSWSASNTLNTYYNGVKIKTNTVTFNNTPSRSLYIGAVHGTVPLYSNASAYDMHIEVTGAWTDAEAQLIYNATKALKSAFGISWI